jgi:hypothetical protein
MDKKINDTKNKITFTEVAKNYRTWETIEKNKWYIKFSICDEQILLIFTSSITDQTLIRYFDIEERAVDFINYIIKQDATKYLST